MRKIIVVSMIVIVFGMAALGAPPKKTSSPSSRTVDFMNRERENEEKTRVAPSQILGNSKTSQRKFQVSENSQGREPSIQAYGLPKRRIENNGFIERIGSEVDRKADEVDNRGIKEPNIQAYGVPKRNTETNGFIERVGANDDEKASASSSGKFASTRRVRSIDEYTKNDLADLEAEEAKVFRPLFVYRQQVADRYRINKKKNPIYGAYQYGNNRQRNFI